MIFSLRRLYSTSDTPSDVAQGSGQGQGGKRTRKGGNKKGNSNPKPRSNNKSKPRTKPQSGYSISAPNWNGTTSTTAGVGVQSTPNPGSELVPTSVPPTTPKKPVKPNKVLRFIKNNKKAISWTAAGVSAAAGLGYGIKKLHDKKKEEERLAKNRELQESIVNGKVKK